MHHDEDVRAEIQRPPVTGLLVPPVTQVHFVADRLQAEFEGQGYGLVGAGVVDEHDLVDHIPVKFSYGTWQRDFCIVCGQHNADPAAVDHPASVWNPGERNLQTLPTALVSSSSGDVAGEG